MNAKDIAETLEKLTSHTNQSNNDHWQELLKKIDNQRYLQLT